MNKLIGVYDRFVYKNFNVQQKNTNFKSTAFLIDKNIIFRDTSRTTGEYDNKMY